MDFDGFEWDDGNVDKCQKHGVSIEQIEALFASGPFILPDILHSTDEERYLAVGQDRNARWFATIFTYRDSANGTLIRPISARYMHAKEIDKYVRQKNSPLHN
jgi:uncharacterized protein